MSFLFLSYAELSSEIGQTVVNKNGQTQLELADLFLDFHGHMSYSIQPSPTIQLHVVKTFGLGQVWSFQIGRWGQHIEQVVARPAFFGPSRLLILRCQERLVDSAGCAPGFASRKPSTFA